MANKTNKQLKVFRSVIFIGAVLGFVFSLWLLNQNYLKLSSFVGISQVNPSNLSYENEDQLSMTQIPQDVLNALDQAKTSGNPVLGIRADGPTYHVPILMYHYIEHVQNPRDTLRVKLNTIPEVLDQQIQTLKQAGYTFTTTSDLANILDGMQKPPNKPIILTFDDSYEDFYTDAFPILKKYNVKSVQYVITGFLDQPDHLSSSQLKEIAQSGLVEIGSHTVHHLALAGLSNSQTEQEVTQSKIRLEEILGFSIVSFAYPYGSFNLNDIQLLKKAGYRSAVSTIPGSQQSNSVRFFAYRLRPGGKTGQTLLNFLQQN